MAEQNIIIPATNGQFDTAALQLAQGRARAIAANSNEEAFLREISRGNDAVNSSTLVTTDIQDGNDIFANNNLPNFSSSAEPAISPSTLALFSQLGSELSTDSLKAQQLHELGILQKDAELLEEAANENRHPPLSNSASTVDLSIEARDLVNGNPPPSSNISLTQSQLTRITNAMEPFANRTLTPAIAQQIQVQLATGPNPIQLSMNTIYLAMSLIASMQPSTSYSLENTFTSRGNNIIVKPVVAIGRATI